jgi:hypothetical protein
LQTREAPVSAEKRPPGSSPKSNTRYQDVEQSEEEEEEQSEEKGRQQVESRLIESSLRENQYKTQLQALQQEKRRLDEERELLMQEKNQESREWRKRYDQMAADHEEVIGNLKEANKCYLAQVGENEELKR